MEVGCFLSGGVDSTLTACKASQQQNRLQCFSVGYAEEAFSELPAARQAAKALGVPCTETTVSAGEFFAANRAIQWYLDEPMPNPAEVPLYFLCKSARQRVKVVLSGEGADELFGGYPLYCQGVHAQAWQRLPKGVRRPGGPAGPGLRIFPPRRCEPLAALCPGQLCLCRPGGSGTAISSGTTPPRRPPSGSSPG